jgi:hypothetical protein
MVRDEIACLLRFCFEERIYVRAVNIGSNQVGSQDMVGTSTD